MDLQAQEVQWPRDMFGRVAGGELRSLWPAWCTTAQHVWQWKKGKTWSSASTGNLLFLYHMRFLWQWFLWSKCDLAGQKKQAPKVLAAVCSMLLGYSGYSPSWHCRNSLRNLRSKSSTAPQIFGRTWPFEYLQHHNITSLAAARWNTVPTVKVGLALQFLPKKERKSCYSNEFPLISWTPLEPLEEMGPKDCLALLLTRAHPRLTTSSTISIWAAEVACGDFNFPKRWGLGCYSCYTPKSTKM